jgi:hypothetical protein
VKKKKKKEGNKLCGEEGRKSKEHKTKQSSLEQAIKNHLKGIVFTNNSYDFSKIDLTENAIQTLIKYAFFIRIFWSFQLLDPPH